MRSLHDTSIGIFVFDDVELLDLAGPYEVFPCAARVSAHLNPGVEPRFSVVTAELGKPEVIEWIAKTAARCELTTSVCTGAFLLAQAGLLTGKRATTHWEDMDELQAMFPQVQVQKQRRWVRDGNTVTSGGISAGIDMSLHLVEMLVSRDLALRTARQMEYAWHENA